MRLLFSPLLKLALFMVLIAGVCGCHSSDKKGQNETQYNEKMTRSLSRNLDLKSVARAHLISEADEELSNWSAFLTMKIEIEKLDNYSLRELIDNNKSILGAIQKVEDSIPEKFETTSIKARLKVLKTKSEVLNQYLNYSKRDTLELQKLGAGIFEAYENLEIQLNEIYLPDYSEFDFDMDRRQDSIQKSKSTAPQ